MRVEITVIDPNSALADVKTVDLFDVLSTIEGINLTSTSNQPFEGKLGRMGVLELLATFITSATAYQLALAIRDFAKKQSIQIKLTIPDHKELIISAKGESLKSVSDIVGFLTQQREESLLSSESENPSIVTAKELEIPKNIEESKTEKRDNKA